MLLWCVALLVHFPLGSGDGRSGLRVFALGVLVVAMLTCSVVASGAESVIEILNGMACHVLMCR